MEYPLLLREIEKVRLGLERLQKVALVRLVFLLTARCMESPQLAPVRPEKWGAPTIPCPSPRQCLAGACSAASEGYMPPDGVIPGVGLVI